MSKRGPEGFFYAAIFGGDHGDHNNSSIIRFVVPANCFPLSR